MLRLAGLLLLFSSATLTGFYCAAELQEQERLLRHLATYLRQFSLQLDCLRAPPAQIAQQLARQQEFCGERLLVSLGQSFLPDGSFGGALGRALAACPGLRKSGVDELLLPLGDVIGVRELSTQLAAIASAVLLLEQRQSVAKDACEKKGGLYRRLGMLAGVLLVVVFL